jgi:hypothetical protein
MMRYLRGAIALCIVAGFGIAVATPQEARADAELFDDKKCTRCHSIAVIDVEKKINPRTGKKRRGPDMSGLGLKDYETDFLVLFLQRKAEKPSLYKEGEEVEHRPRFRGKEEDLRTILAFLQTMKSDIVVEDEGEPDDDDDDE